MKPNGELDFTTVNREAVEGALLVREARGGVSLYRCLAARDNSVQCECDGMAKDVQGCRTQLFQTLRDLKESDAITTPPSTPEGILARKRLELLLQARLRCSEIGLGRILHTVYCPE